MKFIDINCDMGEWPEDVFGSVQESLMPHLTSVNIACGGHAGDEKTMRATIEQALHHHAAIGAHPGYADRAHFGRIELRLTPREIADSIFEQVTTLATIAAETGAAISHVKAHGALYNQAARDPEIARAIAEGVARRNMNVMMIGLAGSKMLRVFAEAGFPVATEAFADRRYEPDGSLRSRKFDDALISDPAEAAAQTVRIAQHGSVIAVNGEEIPIHAQTICIHGDTSGAPQIAASVATALRGADIALRPLQSASPNF
jgi:5-oxoprolinase (ATP-hydrolysing) subunit A